MAAPEPIDWIRGYVRIQQVADREILRVIARAHWDIVRMLRSYEGRPLSISELVRIEQLKTIQRNMMRKQAEIWERLGDIIRARQLQAAALAINLGSAIDDVLLAATGREDDARALKRALTAGTEQSMNTAMARMGLSAVPLSQKIYLDRVWMDGRIQRLINSALLRGLSAREFASEARNWFSPNTPGGVRYAAMRLARTEINNAFHATSVMQAQEKPWISQMKWHLSRSHPKADECDALAKGGKEGDGVYAKNEVPRKPHPQCLCFVTPVPVDEDAFLDAFVAGKYDDYLKSKLR